VCKTAAETEMGQSIAEQDSTRTLRPKPAGQNWRAVTLVTLSTRAVHPLGESSRNLHHSHFGGEEAIFSKYMKHRHSFLAFPEGETMFNKWKFDAHKISSFATEMAKFHVLKITSPPSKAEFHVLEIFLPSGKAKFHVPQISSSPEKTKKRNRFFVF